MVEIFAFLATGILVGWLAKERKGFLAVVDKFILISIFLLLFFLGASIGTDEEVLNSIKTLGLNALLTATGALSGSIVAAWLLWKWLFKTKTHPSS